MKITDDAGYNKALEWMVERAQMIEKGDIDHKNPLKDKADREQWKQQRAEHMRKYDLVEKEVMLYRHPKLMRQEEPKTALAEWLE